MSSFKEIFTASRKPSVIDAEREEIESVPAAPPKERLRRSVGKRSQGSYTQVSAYVRTQTHRNVKIALLQDGDAEDFSDLVERLLAEWLERRNGHSIP